jgi:hypothetical protein
VTKFDSYVIEGHKQPRNFVSRIERQIKIQIWETLATEKLRQNFRYKWDMKCFIECIIETYATTNESDCTIRGLLIEFAHMILRELADTEGFVEDFKYLGEFTAELVFHLSRYQ